MEGREGGRKGRRSFEARGRNVGPFHFYAPHVGDLQDEEKDMQPQLPMIYIHSILSVYSGAPSMKFVPHSSAQLLWTELLSLSLLQPTTKPANVRHSLLSTHVRSHIL